MTDKNEKNNPKNENSEFDEKEIEEADQIFKDIAEEFEQELEGKQDKLTHADQIADKINQGTAASEAVREVLFNSLRETFDEGELAEEEVNALADDGFDLINQKRKELYLLLENLDKELVHKDVKEVTATFSAMLDIQGQLCVQKTEGVITVRSRLFNFFDSKALSSNAKQALRQEITLLFTPEEIRAMRIKLANLPEDDPLANFFTMIVDQAYDVVQYNEMTSYLLLEMCNYFLKKLDHSGYAQAPKVLEFKERRDRSQLSLNKAIEDLKDLEAVINNHLHERPVLLELPKYIRALIQIKLGLLNAKHLPTVIDAIKKKIGEYARARSNVAFDFNRLPSFQHGLHLRQSILLNLQKDILEYSADVFEKEFAAIKDEFSEFLKQIEAATEELDPNSPEYQELMKKKASLQKKIEAHRRRCDVLKNQQKLVDVQHSMVSDAIQRYNKNEAMQKRAEEALQAQASVDPDKVRKADTGEKKKPSRMVMVRRHKRE